MKHILLSFSLVAGIFLSGFSQGLLLKDADGNDITNATLTVHGSPSASYLKAQVYLHNEGEEAIEIWARKIEQEVLPNTFNTFCWADFCYDVSVIESTGGLNLDAGATSTDLDFYGQYFPEGYTGSTIVKYEFFSRNESFETVSVTVTYTADATSAAGPRLSQARIADPRPNPARDFTVFDYQLPPEVRSARLVVRNLTGSVVMEVPLDPSGSRLRLETSSLNNGIFLYSFVVNEQVVLTKKLVVNR